jgi:hypothetical protein
LKLAKTLLEYPLTYLPTYLPTHPRAGTGYLWKKLRGPRHLRPGPVRSFGGPSHGDLTTRGWALFESIDMANAMGVEPIVTLHNNESYQVRYLPS